MRGPGRQSIKPQDDIITVENLVVGYADHVILDGVSFSVKRGEILSILGPSGCGKSTLLKTLAGLISPLSGYIRVAGEEITTENPEEALARVRRHIGVLFQSGALFESLTVSENVALPLEEFTTLPRDLINLVVQLKLDLVDLGKFGNLLPGELSGGMKKRAGLARTMVLDPQILFCDEPGSGLDPVISREVDELLLELNQALGITLIVVTHSLASVDNMSGKCLMLDPKIKGIIASGTLDVLKENKDPHVRGFFHRSIKPSATEE